MSIEEVKSLFKGKLTSKSFKLDRIKLLEEKIVEIKELLLYSTNNIKLKQNLEELLIMRTVIELNNEGYPIEIIEELYEITENNIKVLILELRTDYCIYDNMQEKTIKKIDEFIKKNNNINPVYLSVLKYYQAFYSFKKNNMEKAFRYINKSIEYWDKNANAYRLYARIFKTLDKISESEEMYKLEKKYKGYYKIKVDDYDVSDFEMYILLNISQNLDIIE